MSSKISSKVGGFLLITFILWYLLRQTALGRAYGADMIAIPRYLGAGEGLKSAVGYYTK